ncbi:hypothetical protein [Neorhodopirellula lusitana]|uniref:hypothetical protein n=1 Tax=Neorhodopirellula lusitana TaxID=445327 RepID=UPI00384C66AE
MSIQVTCPSCLKRFQVSDKFAGKSGPCPACKKPIKIPDKSEEVVVHAPDDGAPKDSKGQSVLKPVTISDPELTNRMLIIAGSAVVALLAVAVYFRVSSGDAGPPLWAQLLGVVLLALPLTRIGYSFVHDRELAPYTGIELRNRVLICSGLFVLTWVVYAFVPAYVLELDAANEMSWTTAGITFCIMGVLGALASVACFELEFLPGFIHAGFYYAVVIITGLIAGVKFAGEAIEDEYQLSMELLPSLGGFLGSLASMASGWLL